MYFPYFLLLYPIRHLSNQSPGLCNDKTTNSKASGAAELTASSPSLVSNNMYKKKYGGGRSVLFSLQMFF